VNVVLLSFVQLLDGISLSIDDHPSVLLQSTSSVCYRASLSGSTVSSSLRCVAGASRFSTAAEVSSTETPKPVIADDREFISLVNQKTFELDQLRQDQKIWEARDVAFSFKPILDRVSGQRHSSAAQEAILRYFSIWNKIKELLRIDKGFPAEKQSKPAPKSSSSSKNN
jgi:hypothetical protein